MNNAAVIVPFVAALISLVGVVGRLLLQAHRVMDRLDGAVPTLEKIARTYPGKTLERTLDDLERAISLQSQELARLLAIVDRRRGPSDRRPEGAERRADW